VIGIPFYLAHARLRRIEQKMMFEVEGGTPDACLKLLRHECGHAINYAYRLYTRTRWRELFGRFTAAYSASYAFQPYSKRYVIHLPGSYAQAHPDEDFAETFAVWLAPGNNWQEQYRGWPVLRKLNYVDALMRRIGGEPPAVTASATPWSAARMTSTLEAYYRRRRQYLGQDFPGYYDDILRRIFASREESSRRLKASRLLRSYRRQIMNSVAAYTGERKYDIHELLGKLVRRCDALDLYASGPDDNSLIELSALVAAVFGKTFKPDVESGKR
jgi:hypothetical protein